MDITGYNLENLTEFQKDRLTKNIYRYKNSKKISQKVFLDFYTAIDNIDKYLNNIDFDKYFDRNNGIKLNFPRTTFIKEINDLLCSYPDEDKENFLSGYGFSLIYNDNKITFDLYPFLPEDKTYISSEKLKIDSKIRDIIENYTNNKVIFPSKYSEISGCITIICNTIPEFITSIGKIQHKTHCYTLDIHLLKTMQGFILHDNYKKLDKYDQMTAKIAILIHDMSKKEFNIDKTHPFLSAIDSIAIISRLNLPKTQKIQIFDLIKNHHWSENIDNKSKTYEDIASDFKTFKQFVIAKTFTEADLKAVGGVFYDRFQENLAISSEAIEKILLKNM